MKKSQFLFLAVIISSVLLSSCEKDPFSIEDGSGIIEDGSGGTVPDTPPIASFSITPQTNIIADKTSVHFQNQSTGTISNSQWRFGTGEASSASNSPNYKFDKEGWKTVSLDVGGPAGTSTKTKQIRVHAMDPTLYNYSKWSTQFEGRINELRPNNIKSGKLKIINNYNDVSLKITLYEPNRWLAGIYTPYNNVYWSISPTQTTTLLSGNAPIIISNDWGIQFESNTGIKSCIRSVQHISSYTSNGGFVVKASDLYEG